MIITAQFLEKHKACSDDILLFKRVFGNSVKITPKNIEKAIDNQLSLVWLSQILIHYIPNAENDKVVIWMELRRIKLFYDSYLFYDTRNSTRKGRLTRKDRSIGGGVVVMLLAEYFDQENNFSF